jgi:hypothetical protein
MTARRSTAGTGEAISIIQLSPIWRWRRASLAPSLARRMPRQIRWHEKKYRGSEK